ncbi:hypothetical protein DFJ73DRAFT_143063 [Zopfochytrium polystomum]|nr:hypothetical protein DFJ73DRAFT_143063 [Zopfochytrium polystomum]
MGRLHACLYCERIGCWKIHMQSHIQQEGHIFAMDQHHFTVFCASCNDYVYDVDMERILAAEKCRMEIVVSQVKDPSTKRLKLNEWRPSIEEAQKLKAFSGPVLKCAGLRGLRNMGATCFMNVILQSLIHNPLLRLHFLSDRHNQNLCANRRVGKICVACEMDNLFTNFYSGQNTPYGPTSFLYSIWKTNSALAEYAQQDAHEFFIAVLNEVHNNCVGYENNLNSSNCPCVVHQVFCGSLQSEVTCAKCHNITSTTDPMLDLSLTIRHASKAKHSKTSRKKAAAAAAAAATVGLALPGSASATSASTSTPGDTAPNTADSCHLIECMERYFAAEKLTHYQCGNPACVLSIQLKRFEHSGQGSKVETFVKVPVELDMTPYTTRSVKTRTKRLKRESSGLSRKQSARSLVPFDSVNESIPENKYVLFSVINHQGGLETGHYTAFVKTRGQWFFFDDHNVQLASQRDVLSSNVYMCFYVRANYCMSPNSIVDVCGRTAPSTEYFEEEILASADVSPIRPR